MSWHSTRISKLEDAVREAVRFIEAAQMAIMRMKAEDASGESACCTKENAAAKRASMDLSRTLTELRR
ncbi:hypothetical protein SAMN05443249_2749 [Beijerinckia sp. 28-YEA-48]|nr:hypothetical protein SAMN05443249_2749 [Beijerinckia sp. 28-YEA-48]